MTDDETFALAMSTASRLDLKPGDTLQVFAPVGDQEAMASMALTLRALAVTLKIRVVCIDQGATLQVTPAEDLATLGRLVALRLLDVTRAAPDDAWLARMVSEAAGELGLTILKPRRVDA